MNFINTQSSHLLPIKDVECNRIRTGYERVIAHQVGRNFAGVAEQDGKITSIDEKSQLITVTYVDGSTDIFRYGDIYVEYEGIHVPEVLKPIVSINQKVKKNDIITYNTGYFTLDPTTKQLDYSIGTLANVVFFEKDTTLEDSIEISQNLSERLSISPVNSRVITLPKNSLIHMSRKVGDIVSHTDPLLVFEEDALSSENTFNNVDEETLALLGDLNRKTPTAKFSGKITRIEAFYGCPIADMHITLGTIVRQAIDVQNRRSKIAAQAKNSDAYPPSGVLPKGTKYKGVYFDEDTVCLVFYIQENIKHDAGDKLVIMNQLKCTCAGVFPEDIYTEDGTRIDAFFSQIAVANRIVMSSNFYGVAARCLEKAESNLLDIYFGKKDK